MKDNLSYRIENLPVSEEAKEVLRCIFRVANSINPSIKESVKNLFIICPHGGCLSDYARTYERIIIENGVYKVIGKGTYLELAFPKMGTEKEYAAFYNSARYVAATTNSFVGIFLISFEQFRGYSELNKEPAFERLLKFIDANAKNVSFVFHVLPEFSDPERLASKLNGHVNIMRVRLTKPDITDASEYVTSELIKSAIKLTAGARLKLNALIAQKINFESDTYLGYRTLDRFVRNMVFEVACLCNENKNGVSTINEKVIFKLFETMDFSLEEKEEFKKLGF